MADTPPTHVHAWRQLMHVHAQVTDAIDRALKDGLGIPGTWYEALVEIAFAGGTMQMSEFAEETTLTKSGATRFVDRLVEAGLVERVQCPTDRRIWQLELTVDGKRLQEKADPIVLEVLYENFSRHLTRSEAKVMLANLSKVRDQAG